MRGSKRWLLILIAAALMAALVVSVSAQATTGTLTLGQPLSSQITAGATISYPYNAANPAEITIQALSDKAQPTLTLLSGGSVVAQQANASGSPTISLSTLVNSGSYVLEVGTANNTSGLVIVVLQSETAVTTTPLTPDTPVTGSVSPTAPLALYSFTSGSTQSFLFVRSNQGDNTINMRLIDTTSGAVSGQISPDLIGARFRIKAGNTPYRVEIEQGAADQTDAFTVCLAVQNIGGCDELGAAAGTGPVVVQPPAATPELQAAGNDCLVTPSSGNSGVNIRQSASPTAQILTTMPRGDTANVIGISPDKAFYNILYQGLNGWVSIAVIVTSGDCSNVLTINPPPVIAAATTIPFQPTNPPAPTASGPCAIQITAPTYVYQIPQADQEKLFDQAQPGGQLTPTGRLADNSWWQVMEYGYPEWLSTSTIGHSVQVSGNCNNLPVVSAP
ncbi:MAG TPA: SH3 domain-containing protein [Phototrophicaceae bacterium]|nr:SH3 domain-containing protein [Phototrophicaceae bacterium]